MNTKMKWVFSVMLAFSLILGGGLTYYFQQGEGVAENGDIVSKKDPLREILEQDDENSLKADFLTDNLYPYTGPVTGTLARCVDNGINALHGSYVFASLNPEIKIDLTPQEIFNDINPVLGYAVRNKQINWEWDYRTRKYTFMPAKGDEKLWWCYFRNETEFFQSFLDKDTVSVDLENEIKFSFHKNIEPYSQTVQWLESYYSTAETKRYATGEVLRFHTKEIRRYPTYEVPRISTVELKRIERDQLNSISLGYLHIASSEDINLPFFPLNIDITDGIGEIPVEYRNEYRNANPDDELFLQLITQSDGVRIFPTSEITRKEDAYSALKGVKIVRATKDYDPLADVIANNSIRNQSEIKSPYEVFEVILDVSGHVTEGSEYTMEINTKFLEWYFDRYHGLRFNPSGVDSMRSQAVKLTYEYDDCYTPDLVCGSKNNTQKIYLNQCRMHKDGARLVKNGICDTEPIKISELSILKTKKVRISTSSFEVARIAIESNSSSPVYLDELDIDIVGADYPSITGDMIGLINGQEILFEKDGYRYRLDKNIPTLPTISSDKDNIIYLFADINQLGSFRAKVSQLTFLNSRGDEIDKINHGVLEGPLIESKYTFDSLSKILPLLGAEVCSDPNETPLYRVMGDSEYFEISDYRFSPDNPPFIFDRNGKEISSCTNTSTNKTQNNEPGCNFIPTTQYPNLCNDGSRPLFSITFNEDLSDEYVTVGFNEEFNAGVYTLETAGHPVELHKMLLNIIETNTVNGLTDSALEYIAIDLLLDNEVSRIAKVHAIKKNLLLEDFETVIPPYTKLDIRLSAKVGGDARKDQITKVADLGDTISIKPVLINSLSEDYPAEIIVGHILSVSDQVFTVGEKTEKLQKPVCVSSDCKEVINKLAVSLNKEVCSSADIIDPLRQAPRNISICDDYIRLSPPSILPDLPSDIFDQRTLNKVTSCGDYIVPQPIVVPGVTPTASPRPTPSSLCYIECIPTDISLCNKKNIE